MKCPKCQQENVLTARFCSRCGRLLIFEAGYVDTLPRQSGETPAPQTPEARAEVRRLIEVVVSLNDRLMALEKTLGPRPASQPLPGVVAPLPSPPPGLAASPSPIVQIPAASVHSPASAAPAPRKSREWEQILGGSWLARIGVLALIIGNGFFLKFAFDQNWLGPWVRVILVVADGLVMLGAGYYWRKRYSTLSQALSGGGIAVLYLAIFAAFAFFRLLNVYLSIVLLFAVSALSAALAIRQNSMALAIIGILGAFIAPVILQAVGPSGARVAGTGLPLLVYIMVVDIGVIALASFRNWRWFVLLAFFGSMLSYGLWYAQFGHKAGLFVSEGSLTILFLMFIGASMLYHFIWRRPPEPFDYVLMVLNAATYFGISYSLMWADLRAWMGGFTLLLALFYGGLAYLARRRSTETVMLGLFALGIALVFLTIAVPVQIGDRAWTTIAWAAETVVLMWLYLRLKLPLFRAFGYGAFIVMGLRLLFFDTAIKMPVFRVVINERFLAFSVSIAAIYLAARLLWRQRENMKVWLTVFLVAANFLTIWLFSFEIWSYFDSWLAVTSAAAARVAFRNAQNLSLTALWTLYAVALLVIGIRRRWRPVRLWALGLLAVPIIKVFVFDVWTLQTIYRVIAFVGLGLLLIASAYLYQRYSKAIRGFISAGKLG